MYPRSSALSAEHDDVGDEGGLDRDADAHPEPGGQAAPGDEALDEAGGDEHRHEAQDDHDRPSALVGGRLRRGSGHRER